MCRLAYFPNITLSSLQEEEIFELLAYIEGANGGDGNGYGGFIDGEAFFKKGVKLSMREIAHDIREIKWDRGVIVHTRKASMGSVCNENCHPFLYGQTLLAHNGHWATGAKDVMKIMAVLGTDFTGIPASRLVDMTDSEVIAYLIDRNGEDASEMAQGVILTMTPEKVRVHNHYGDFTGWLANEDKDAWVYMSAFPKTEKFNSVMELGRDTIALIEDKELHIQKGTTIAFTRSYNSATFFDKEKGKWMRESLPAPSSRAPALPHKKSTKRPPSNILEYWNERFEKIREERDEFRKKSPEGRVRKLTRSEKKHAKKTGKILLRLLLGGNPAYWEAAISALSMAEKAALEVYLQLSVRNVNIPSLRPKDFAERVLTFMENTSGGK